MCHQPCIDFAQTHLDEKDVKGKSIIEVGSFNVNGSLRTMVEDLYPSSYIGVDIQNGPTVDYVCDANDLVDHFGQEKFDVLISTELLEHVRDWRNVIRNFKEILKPNGIMLITTRSKGFPYHAWPFDYWRYEISDLRVVFSDFNIKYLKKDPVAPGVFMKAVKPSVFSSNNLDSHQLYSIVKGKRVDNVREFDIYSFKIRYKIRCILSKILFKPIREILSNILPDSVKRLLKKAFIIAP